MVHLLRIAAALLLCSTVVLACSGPVPTRSGSSSAPEAGTRVYHVQLQLTEDKEQAAAILGRGQQWWSAQPDSTRPPLVQGTASADPPVNIVWKAPYYRVRLGPFATKTQAETVLDEARPAFPDAFVAPDRVEASSTETGTP